MARAEGREEGKGGAGRPTLLLAGLTVVAVSLVALLARGTAERPESAPGEPRDPESLLVASERSKRDTNGDDSRGSGAPSRPRSPANGTGRAILSPSTALRGELVVTLVDDVTGEPVVGRPVMVWTEEDYESSLASPEDVPMREPLSGRGGLREWLATDSGGEVVVLVQGEESLIVNVHRGEDAAVRELWSLVEPPVLGERERIVVDEPGRTRRRVTGRVVAAEDGTPIEGAVVSACQAFYDHFGGVGESVFGRATTAADGRFELDVTIFENVYLRARAPGYGARTARANDERSRGPVECELRLPRSATSALPVGSRWA